jgi:octaprenyl-diphosphate synthase
MQHIRASVAEDFDRVNTLIVEQLRSSVPMVENIGHYIVEAGGKRLRPLLVLLVARACGYLGDDHIRLAAVIEFIHTATLLHDDVVDISHLRRGRPTANAEFGNASSVLVGDFLYSRAFQMMVALGHMDIMSRMADTTNTIAEGEVLQLLRAGQVDVSEAQYFDVITRKTAILFAASCHCAALLAQVDEAQREALARFGLNIGIAFQIIDDVLDYEGDPAVMGKSVGDDLVEGKLTLPLIHTLREGTAKQRDVVAKAVQQKSRDTISAVLSAVRDSGALDWSRTTALRYRDMALHDLDSLPPSRYREALEAIAELALQRQS